MDVPSKRRHSQGYHVDIWLFLHIGVVLFWGPCMRDPVILGHISGPLILADSHTVAAAAKKKALPYHNFGLMLTRENYFEPLGTWMSRVLMAGF